MVERYGGLAGGIVPADDGPWVRYSDYMVMEADRDFWKERLQVETRARIEAEALSRTGAVKGAELPVENWTQADEIAALKAENERLVRERDHHSDLREQYLAEAERTLAERAGGVKVRHVLVEAREFVSAVFGENQPARSWAYELRGKIDIALSALTTEPAAPATSCYECGHELNGPYCPKCRPAAQEGRQEVVDAVIISARKLAREYRPSMDKEVLHSWASDVVKVISVLSTRPAEQAVTEAMTWSVSGGHLNFKLPTGTDMIVVFEDKMQHIPVWIGMRHQLSVDLVEHLLTGASSITVAPYRNASKVRIDRAALKTAMEAGRHD